MRNLVRTLWGVVVCFWVCSLSAATAVVSVPPYRPIVEALLGEDAKVDVLLPPGQSCETYQPRPSQLSGLARADLVVLAGVDYEQAWRRRLGQLAPKAVVVDLKEDDHAHHDHDHAHDHHDHAPHQWTSPAKVLAQVDALEAGVKQLPGIDAAAVAERAEALRERLRALQTQIETLLAPYDGRLMLSYHPAFDPLGDEVGFRTLSIESGAAMPSPSRLREIIQTARQAGVTTVYVQPQDPKTAAQRVAQALGGQLVTIDPLEEDYFANLLAIAEQLATNWKAEHVAE
ncbi:MAG: zinc ABC transporter substrate-binding protein [Verrucomicrobiota bacterium JB022]|nr:zinc ABC transporter substrate-binding protein [Verrucomicrobiota bacterium JB022]